MYDKEKLSELMFYRNLFSYEYYNFTEKDVLKALKDIDVIKEFIKRMKSKINMEAV